MTGPIKELDDVKIPQDIAERHGVVDTCTVVFYSESSKIVTVECRHTSNNDDGLSAELIDIPLERMTGK
jgi:hypothetical protein